MIKTLAKARQYLGRGAKRALEHYSRWRLLKHPRIATMLGEEENSPSTGCDYTDYWSLYHYIRKHKPQEVLELGSGVSTSLLALALKENDSGRLTSMEESEEYFHATEKIIPDDLRHVVDLRLSRSVEDYFGPFRGTRYASLPDRVYDFVLIDGPQYDADTSFDLDILRIIEKSARPVTAFVDSRTGSCFIYHLVLGKKLKFSYLRRLGIIDGATQKDIRPYRKIVAASMKRREFKRAW